MNTAKWISIILFLIWSAGAAPAAIITVDPGGSGDALTIQGGLDLALSGDTVLVHPGTYVENLTMAGGVVLESVAGPEATVINGDGDMCINSERCGPGTRVSGFTLTEGGGYVGGGIRVFDQTEIEIDHNIILNNQTTFEGAGVSVQLNSTADIHDNRFLGNVSYKTAAITVIQNATAKITGNFFKNNLSTDYAGVLGVHQSAVVFERNLVVENKSGSYAGTIDFVMATGDLRHNTFLRNLAPTGGSCLREGGLSQLYLENNLFAHNGGGAPAVSTTTCQMFSCNIFWDNDVDYEGPCDPIDAANNRHVNPLVCNPAADGGAVSEFSPCLGGTCGLIGFNPTPGCADDVVALEQENWGSLKAMYR